MTDRRDGVARYQQVSGEYLEQRSLQKKAGWVLLWALGVGAVISGDYFGWNYGLAAGGFWGLALATLVMALMYVCMVFSIAELSTALPHAGGFYSFVRNAMGPTAGFVCGVTDTIEYVITPAVIVFAIGKYLETFVYGPAGPERDVPVLFTFGCWFIAYGLFIWINIRGVELTLKVGLVVTALAFTVLVVFYVSALATGAFSWDRLFNIPAEAGHSPEGLPFGLYGVFAALPFAIWFYLAIEQLPLAAEESHDAVRDMPRALLLGILTLLALSLGTLFINTGVGGGALAMGKSDTPLADGLPAVFGSGAMTSVFTLIALAGFVASFHTIIYAYGRVLFALSRAGYFPRWISVVNHRQTPYRALLLGAGVGLGCVTILYFFEKKAVGAALLNMAVFGAVISYGLVMVSFIILRIRRPDLPRPYRSPLGIPGALVGALLSGIALAACFANEDFRPGVTGSAIFLLVCMGYFFLYSRRRLVAQAPEEEVALIAQGQRELSGEAEE